MHASPQEMVASTETADTHIRHLYMHVPFCEGACSYCAFYKEPFAASAIPFWLKACEHEIRQAVRTHSFTIETLYMGGGTPSLLEPAQFQELQHMLERHLNLDQCREWTIEANPESVSEPKSAAWQQAGVTRISLGVQSLTPGILTRMGRRHDVAAVHKAATLIKELATFSMGIDLIAGYPGITDPDWEETIEGVLALGPDHISVYECTLHPGTALTRQIACCREQETSPARRERALLAAHRSFKRAGFDHYEVSNYAKPGKRCQHNMAVWRGEDYLGLGPSASSRAGSRRWTNCPDLSAYILGAENGRIPRLKEKLSLTQDATERLMFAFRLRDPVCLQDYLPHNSNLAAKLLTYWEQQLHVLGESGFVYHKAGRWRTTSKGRKFADQIAEALIPIGDY